APSRSPERTRGPERARSAEEDPAMRREAIRTSDAPAPVGPYSQAIRAGQLLFASGQIPLDPATGKIVAGEIEDEARRVLANLEAVLRAGGSGLDRVVKATVYLTDLALFPR